MRLRELGEVEHRLGMMRCRDTKSEINRTPTHIACSIKWLIETNGGRTGRDLVIIPSEGM